MFGYIHGLSVTYKLTYFNNNKISDGIDVCLC